MPSGRKERSNVAFPLPTLRPMKPGCYVPGSLSLLPWARWVSLFKASEKRRGKRSLRRFPQEEKAPGPPSSSSRLDLVVHKQCTSSRVAGRVFVCFPVAAAATQNCSDIQLATPTAAAFGRHRLPEEGRLFHSREEKSGTGRLPDRIPPVPDTSLSPCMASLETPAVRQL